MAADRLLIFCRAPRAGRAKTRLVPPLTPEAAAALYEACVHDVIRLAALERARLELWCDEAGSRAYFLDRFPQIPLFTQPARSLGERQADAFERSFADGAERVVILGSDSPTLPDSHLHAAFDFLRDDSAVMGPAYDGGYYLIGLTRSAWPRAVAALAGIEWSTAEVLGQVQSRAAAAGCEFRLLPAWYDVDTPADLALLQRDAAQQSHVGRWLREYAG